MEESHVRLPPRVTKHEARHRAEHCFFSPLLHLPPFFPITAVPLILSYSRSVVNTVTGVFIKDSSGLPECAPLQRRTICQPNNCQGPRFVRPRCGRVGGWVKPSRAGGRLETHSDRVKLAGRQRLPKHRGREFSCDHV